MKRILIGVGIVIVIIGGFFLFREERVIKNYPSNGTGVIAFGDSLIVGVGSTHKTGFVGLLQNLIKEPIRNYGRSGDTTAQGKERLPEMLAENPHPKVVIVLLGGNDYLRRVPSSETFANLRSIITDIQRTGAVVLLLGVRGGIVGDAFEEKFELLAEETGSAYVSDVLEGLYGREAYMSDTVHPNDAGYSKITTRVYPVLKKLLEE